MPTGKTTKKKDPKKRGDKKAVRAGLPWRSFLICLFVLAVFLSAGFANVWVSQKCRVLTFHISKLDKQIKREREIGHRLEVEVARLRSPRRIERIAVTKLGLQTPTPDQIITVP